MIRMAAILEINASSTAVDMMEMAMAILGMMVPTGR
jgi:hypothetical protein